MIVRVVRTHLPILSLLYKTDTLLKSKFKHSTCMRGGEEQRVTFKKRALELSGCKPQGDVGHQKLRQGQSS